MNNFLKTDMQLIQLFVPLYKQDGSHFPKEWFSDIKDKLTGRFGGLTVYQRGPATGLWKEETGNTTRDDLIIYEVMAEQVEIDFWKSFKSNLERQFEQQELLIRYHEISLIP